MQASAESSGGRDVEVLLELDASDARALTLAKLCLMEAELEAEDDTERRVAKRTATRAYVTAAANVLELTSVDDQPEIGWLPARQRAEAIVADWPIETLGPHLEGLGADSIRYLLSSPELAAVALEAQSRRSRQARMILIELIAFAPWDAGTRWSRGTRAAALAAFAGHLGLPSAIAGQMDRNHTTIAKKLARDDLDKRKLALWVGGGMVAATVTGGLAAPAIGGFIGGAMGLTGVAATSAGLALMGGGSLAAGGFGMAGGTALIAGLVGAGGAGVGAGVWLKSAKVGDLVVEGAKLDLVSRYVLSDEEDADALQRSVVQTICDDMDELHQIIEKLTAQLAERPTRAEVDRLEAELEEERSKHRVLDRLVTDLEEVRVSAGPS